MLNELQNASANRLLPDLKIGVSAGFEFLMNSSLKDMLPVISHGGDNIAMKFGVHYLLKILNAITSETINIGMSEANAQITIKPCDDTDRIYVLMPQRTY